MRNPAELDEIYCVSPFFKHNRDRLQALRNALGSVRGSAYRGIGRYPFTEYAEQEPGWQWEFVKPADLDPEAWALLNRFLGPDDFHVAEPRSFLPDAHCVKAVYAALHAPEKYEIAEVCVPPEVPAQLLGYDVGYWGGGNFSILCDAAIWPLWHPPATEAFSGLAEATTDLNAHSLFPTPEAANGIFVGIGASPGPKAIRGNSRWSVSVLAVIRWVRGIDTAPVGSAPRCRR